MLLSMANLLESTPKSSLKLAGQRAASGSSSMVAKATGSTSMLAPSWKPWPKASSTESSSANPSKLTPPMAVMVLPTSRCGCPGCFSMRSTRMPQQVGVSSKPAPCSAWTRRCGPAGFCLGFRCSWTAAAGACGAPQSWKGGAAGAAGASQSAASPAGVTSSAPSASPSPLPAYLGPVFVSDDQLLPLLFFFASLTEPSAAMPAA
mmetsp:Transcript_29827/g.69337  ORF Transcript_29827/g.69337 Transcript_29827/m.69337 type:complete len:205 (-) Transcript_29827:246-860(-)